MSEVEVEVKYRVTDLPALVTALAAHGVQLSDPVTQDDQAYAPVGWSYGDAKNGITFVRLRTVAGRHTFTTKTPRENALSCQEHETLVLDRDAMHAAVQAMGYRSTTRIVKTRRTGRHDQVTICVDEVDGLGAFLELERMIGSSESGEQVQRDLAGWVWELGVDVERTTETYDSLVRGALQPA